jgi:hypothetical protein
MTVSGNWVLMDTRVSKKLTKVEKNGDKLYKKLFFKKCFAYLSLLRCFP